VITFNSGSPSSSIFFLLIFGGILDHINKVFPELTVTFRVADGYISCG